MIRFVTLEFLLFYLIISVSICLNDLHAQVNSVQKAVTTIDEFIADIPQLKRVKTKVHNGQLDSLSNNYDYTRIISYWYQDKLIQFVYADDNVIRKKQLLVYIVAENLLCVEVEYAELIASQGANFYERKLKGKYYFEKNNLIYLQEEGNSKFIEKRHKENFSKELIQEVNTLIQKILSN